MSSSADSPGESLLRLWKKLSSIPLGHWMFDRLLGLKIPYTGSVGASVQDLERGFARVALRDRRRVRNHLRSIHAIALANLGELTTGLALTTSLASTQRAIPIRIEIDYVKKARGRLVAECRTEAPPEDASVEQVVVTEIRDPSSEIVATLKATWKIGPR